MTQQESRPDPQDRILASAMEHFARAGFAGAGVRSICETAGVNVAAVNYYFRSKEQLYIHACRRLFEDLALPLTRIPDRVCDAASWTSATEEWITTVLGWMLTDQPPHAWMVRIFAHERHAPSSALPVLMENFIRPIQSSLERLLRMVLPGDVDEVTLRMWRDSVFGQITMFADHVSPWEQQLLPSGVSRADWIVRMSRHIAGGIACRLSFRADSTAAAGSPDSTPGLTP